jgi:hypothetical protein
LIKYVTFLENLSISYSYSLTKNQYKKCFFWYYKFFQIFFNFLNLPHLI